MTKKPGRPRIAEPSDPNAAAVREFRDKYGLNTTQVGDVLGVPARTIENIEQGRGFRYPRLLDLALRNFKKRDLTE